MRHLSFKHPFYLLLSTIFLAIQTFAAGVIDTTFGINGTVTTEIGTNASVVDIAIQTDNKAIVAGTLATSAIDTNIVLVRYNQNGTLDTTFGTGGKVTIAPSGLKDLIYDIELQPDGKIIVVGQTQTVEGMERYDCLVIRVNPNGTLDSTFGTNGILIWSQSQQSILRKVTVHPSGKISIIGNRGLVFRLTQTGSFDSSFGTNGILYYELPVDQSPNQPATFSEGFYDISAVGERILVTYSSSVDWQGSGPSDGSTVHLIMLDEVGNVYVGFGTNGRVSASKTYTTQISPGAIKVLPTGEIFVSHISGNHIYSANGVLQKTFWFSANNASISSTGKVISRVIPYSGQITLNLYFNKKLIGSASVWGNFGLDSNDKATVAVPSGNNFVLKRVSFSSQGTRIGDFDNDEKSEISVYRPSNRTYYILRSGGLVPNEPTEVTLLATPIKIVPEKTAILFFGNFRQYISFFDLQLKSQPVYFVGSEFQIGAVGDFAVGGDFDGDGSTEASIFRPSNGTWYSYYYDAFSVRTITFSCQWGTSGDKPVPADYDYDGMTDYAVYRPSNGTWYIRKSSDNSAIVFQWGISSDIPLTGDFDADGKADFTVYRASEGKWYQYLTTEGVKITQFGLATDSPVPGDYDGDGRHDIAIYRNGNWWLLQSRDGLKVVQWGTTGDIPVSVRYDN